MVKNLGGRTRATDLDPRLDSIVPLAWSPAQTAKALNWSRSLLYKEWREGRGPPFFHVGELRFCLPDKVKTFLDEQQQAVERGKPRRGRPRAA
jgi:hypothetical protein